MLLPFEYINFRFQGFFLRQLLLFSYFLFWHTDIYIEMSL